MRAPVDWPTVWRSLAAPLDLGWPIAASLAEAGVGRQRQRLRQRVIVPMAIVAALCCYCHGSVAAAAGVGGVGAVTGDRQPRRRPARSFPLSWAMIVAAATWRWPAAIDVAAVHDASVDAAAVGADAAEDVSGCSGWAASVRRGVGDGDDGADDDVAVDAVIVAIGRCEDVENVDVSAADEDVDAAAAGVDVDDVDDCDVVQHPICVVKSFALTQATVANCWALAHGAVEMRQQPNGRAEMRLAARMHATTGMLRLHARPDGIDGGSFAEYKARSVAVG